MKPRPPIPELEQAVEAHARAIAAGDLAAAEKFVAEPAREGHRNAFANAAELRALDRFEILARAKIGFQYMIKVRWFGARGPLTWQNRWSEDGRGGWTLIEAEDMGTKRSGWTGIPTLATANPPGGNSHA